MKHVLTIIAATVALTAACSAEPPAEGSTLAEPGCHDSSIEHLYDLEYLGPIDQSDNARLHVGSSDGTCGGTDHNVVTVIQADVRDDASTSCEATGATSTTPLYYAGYDVVAGYYLCLDIIATE